MRGIPSLITDIRKKVYTEVARMAYSGEDYTKAEDLPFLIVPGDQPLHRESIFLERAIAGERVRLAMGLSVRSVQTRSLMTEGMDHAAIAQQYYEPPLVNIIPYACHACPTNQYRVTENCQNCLAASCQQVCPREAIRFVNIALFVLNGSFSRYSPSCANRAFASGGSVLRASQYAVYRNSRMDSASVMPMSAGCSAKYVPRTSRSFFIHRSAPFLRSLWQQRECYSWHLPMPSDRML